jgi:predicted nucleotidyltransferase
MPNIEDAVSPKWRTDIKAKVKQIEAEENIQILLAIESGSRAWGFHSPDSDYDVRFIYARPVDWHLSLHKKRDVVERPIDGDWDLSGWELSKALTLALGSNAVLAEWLQSPIVYTEVAGFRAEMTSFCGDVLDRKSVTWHYLSLLARQRQRSTDADGNIRLKRYFYMLRPTLALRWMRINNAPMPPMNMAELMAGAQLDPMLEAALTDLIKLKKKLTESGAVVAVDPILDGLIMAEEELATSWVGTTNAQPKDAEMWARASEINIRLTRSILPSFTL